jgi:hypothetical protein
VVVTFVLAQAALAVALRGLFFPSAGLAHSTGAALLLLRNVNERNNEALVELDILTLASLEILFAFKALI